jgi:hypothetical protein
MVNQAFPPLSRLVELKSEASKRGCHHGRQIIKAVPDHRNARNRPNRRSIHKEARTGGSFREAMRAIGEPEDFFKAFLVTRESLV